MQALWMVLAAFMFASMGVCVKLASVYFNPAELVCYRGFIGMAILALLARSQGITLATRRQKAGVWWGSRRCTSSWTTTYSTREAGRVITRQWK